VDSNNLNAARASAAGNGSTEPNIYLRNAQMQTSPTRGAKSGFIILCEQFLVLVMYFKL